jgi:hypothetical protein
MYPRAVALAFLLVVAALSLALTQDAPNQSPGMTKLPEVVVTAPRQQIVQRRRAPAPTAPGGSLSADCGGLRSPNVT